MEQSLKRQIVNAAEAVKRKVRKMRNMESDNEKALESVFKPIINPLNQMVETNKHNTSNDTANRQQFKIDDDIDNDSFTEKTLLKTKSDVKFPENDNLLTKDNISDLDDSISNSDYDSDDNIEHQNISNTSYKTVESNPVTPSRNESSWSLSSEFYEDVPYGVRNDRGKLMMGSARVTIAGDYITIAGQKYKKTIGLSELLFKKVPDISVITQEDTQHYKMMLLDTNVHRRDYDPNKPIKSNKGRKYLNIIKPLFKLRKVSASTDSSVAHGTGLPLMKKLNKHTYYVYWDDPNELVERLKLLIASRNAGNTGLDNEIISILEELRESNLIQ